jgi:hypothetical protein
MSPKPFPRIPPNAVHKATITFTKQHDVHNEACGCVQMPAPVTAGAPRERCATVSEKYVGASAEVEECWIHLVQMCVIESRKEWESRHPRNPLSMAVFAALYKRDTKAEEREHRRRTRR